LAAESVVNGWCVPGGTELDRERTRIAQSIAIDHLEPAQHASVRAGPVLLVPPPLPPPLLIAFG